MTLDTHSRFFLPVVCVALGAAVAGAQVIGGHPGEAVFGAALFAAIAAALLLGGRSETIRVVRGDQPDERWKMHDMRATAFAGIVLILVIIGAWIVEIARGHDGSPYQALGALAGIAYLGAVITLRVRG
jgi:hypothetical protein